MTQPDEPTTDRDERGRERRQLLALLAPLLTLAPRDVLAQDAAGVQPRAYRVALENDKLRVLEFQRRPGLGVCGEGMHSHPAHLTVVLASAKVRVKQADGKMFETEVKAGDVLWSEAETHEVENLSGRDTHALIIELKGKA